MTKICTKCRTEKLLERFSKRTKSKDGLQHICRECVKISSKEWYDSNIQRRKKYIEDNREKVSERYKKWHLRNKQSITERMRIYSKNKRKEDIPYKLKKILKDRFKQALKNNYKTGSAVRDLGCSIDDLKFWLEFWFDNNMSWDNYGNKEGQWSIDHIRPLSSFDLADRKQVLEVCNYKNLQPLWHHDNLIKSNKIEG